MTIKKHGGIFGRNPTFNDVEVDGTLTVGGNAVPDASTLLVDGDIGSTVQAYDADTAKLDVAQTFTAQQTHNEIIKVDNDTTSGLYNYISEGLRGGIYSTDTLTGVFSYAGNPVIISQSNGGTELARFDNGGISFNGDTATANVLDDYEEGTWTPVFNGVTGGSQRGTYTKVGDLVTAYGYMDGGTATVVQASVTGLPFAAGSEKGAVHSWHNTWTPTSNGGWVYQSGTNLLFITDNSLSAENAASGTQSCMFVAIYKT